MEFRQDRGIGHCGLACVLCSYEDCPGCAAKTAGNDGCSTSECAAEKGIDGCFACSEYPCGENMLQGKRNKAFNRYAVEYGQQALIDRLRLNFQNGITYHKPDETAGDYDVLETEDEIYRLLRYGRSDPYQDCPIFETTSLKLRQVHEDDAEELLCFYGDLSRWMFFGNDMCNSIFLSRYATAEEMKKCIGVWLDEYENKFYIRLSVIDKATGQAVGTIEVFDNIGKGHELESIRRAAAIHIDLSDPYETREYISELLELADKSFFTIFGVKYLLIRAIPTAAGRIAALDSAGYTPIEWESGREHYYVKANPSYPN